jgi:mRNA interferase MazF
VVTPRPILRGDIWLVGLDPTVGREIQKTRPCLVVSPDSMNRFLGTVVAVPLTTGSRPAKFRVPIVFKATNGLLLCDQLRTLDKTRFVKRLGTTTPVTLKATLAVLRELFEE